MNNNLFSINDPKKLQFLKMIPISNHTEDKDEFIESSKNIHSSLSFKKKKTNQIQPETIEKIVDSFRFKPGCNNFFL